MNFLLQFASGEANRIVTGYSHLNAEAGYKAALDEFKDLYGDPDVIAQAYVKIALNRQTYRLNRTTPGHWMMSPYFLPSVSLQSIMWTLLEY